MSTPTESLAAALAAFQAEIPHLTKGQTADTGSYSYKYADLADVTNLVLPRLGALGLSFTSKPTLNADGKFVLAYRLLHSPSGEFDSGEYPLPSGTPQQVGSAITYARRYALCAVTGIAADEDDDGKAAKETRVEPVRYWDPVEQDVLRTAYEAEITDASTTEEIADVGRRVLAAKKSGEISPATYEHVAKAGAARKAELNGAPK